MPFDQVEPGMDCTAYSVVRGTEPASFDAEVVDVIGGSAAGGRILVRVSGPAVDETGLGQGFSGSPVYCPDSRNQMRVAAAISESVGDYGNTLDLATPIEAILAEPPDAPAPPPPARAVFPGARRLAVPLSFTGLSAPVAQALRRGAARAGRTVYTAPAVPRQAAPPPPPKRGSAVAAALATGDVTAAAIGTVAYVDGDKVWAFGHPLDAVGGRQLSLQDAYVFTVVGNPIGGEEATTYKLAAPWHDIGAVTNDAPSAVVGRLGALPERFPLRILTTDLDTGRRQLATGEIADETAIGQPTGISGLTAVAPAALAEAVHSTLRGTPAHQSGEMCVRISLRERPKPLRFCNTYVGGGGRGSAGAPLVADFTEGLEILDAFKFGPIHVSGVSVTVELRRGLRQAYLLGVSAPRFLRRGSRVRLRLKLRRAFGARFTRTITVRVPRTIPSGPRTLMLTGTPADAGGDGEDLGAVFTIAFDDGGESIGARNLTQLAKRFSKVHRYDGVSLSFPPPGSSGIDSDEALPPGPEGAALKPRETYRDKELRISGRARFRVFVE